MVAAGAFGVAAANAFGLPLPPCPLRTFTGIPCPGCGAGRSISALLEGNVAAAIDHNVLVPLALALIVWSVAVAVARRAGRRWWDPLTSRAASIVTAATLGAFWLLRLLPWGPTSWLAP